MFEPAAPEGKQASRQARQAGRGRNEGGDARIDQVLMRDMFYDLQNKETNKSLLNAIKILCVVAR